LDRQGYSRRLLLVYIKDIISLNLTMKHWAGVRQFTSYCYLALSCVFNKQSPSSILCHYIIIIVQNFKIEKLKFLHNNIVPLLPKLQGHLPSSLNPVISYALVYSTKLRELVLSTVNYIIKVFLNQINI